MKETNKNNLGGSIEIINGDCLEVLKKYPDNYFSSCVSDPPY